MHSMTIQPRACPQCGIRQTTRLGRSSTNFCFNCRWHWQGDTHHFSPGELARLEIYRAAVRHGFYTDFGGLA